MNYLIMIKMAAVAVVGIGVGMTLKQLTGKRVRVKSPSEKGGFLSPEEAYARLIENEALIKSLTEKSKQAELDAKSLAETTEKLKSESIRFAVDNQTLSNRVRELEQKLEISGRLEKILPDLVDWIQSVIGYAGNKEMFPNDADELSRFRDDAKRLPRLIRRNGIECDGNPPEQGVGFLRVRDARVEEGTEIISAPMLLRDGVIVAEGIILVPDVAENDNPFQEEGATINGSQHPAEPSSDLAEMVPDNSESCSEQGKTSVDRQVESASPLWDFGL